MSIILTLEQQSIADKFDEFLHSNYHILIIKGSAGTGKTTLLKHLIEVVDKKNIASFLMAPSGRASKILEEKTGKCASTIHRSLYLLNKDREDIDDDTIFCLRKNDTPDNSIYFVDEASMVGDIYDVDEDVKFGSGRLLSDLLLFSNCTHSRRKIVFIGDHAQLPPIMQIFSPALSEEYLNKEYGVSVQTAMLTNVVRQTLDSGIYKNANEIRKSIDTKEYNKFGLIESEDVKSFSMDEFLERYNEMKAIDGEEEIMVITPSNAQALNYNEIIRHNKYRITNPPLQVGDILLVTHNNYTQGKVLFNGSFVRVHSVSNEVESHVAFVGKDEIILNFRSIELLISGAPFRYYILDDFLTTRDGKLPLLMRKALWANFVQRMHKEGIKQNSPEFKKRKMIDPYFNSLHCKYGYAITCHKSQGGEWKNVFVDMNVWMGSMSESFFRWSYTAITRAKSRLFHISSPEFNAISQFVMHPIMQCKAGGIVFSVPQGVEYKEFFATKIKEAATRNNWSCTDTYSISWQHRFLLSTERERCTLIVWYNSKFYTGKIDVLEASSQEFASQCKQFIKVVMHTIDFTFVPKFEFQAQMHAHIMDVLNDCGLSLMNVVQNQWDDVYYIATDADTASVKFYYNAKGLYTQAIPSSTLGADDSKLQHFIVNI